MKQKKYTEWKGHFFLCLLLSLCCVLQAQQRDKYLVGISYGYGKVLKQTEDIAALGNTKAHSVYADLGIRTGEIFSWAGNYGNPYFGFSIFYNAFSEQSIGHSAGIFPFLDNTHTLFSSPFFIKYHIGMGPVYVSSVFDIETNYVNQAVSTHLNLGADLRFGMGVKIHRRILLYFEPGILHFSNMAFNKPNYGINLINLTGGLSCVFGEHSPVQQNEFLKQNEWEAIVLYNGGTRQIAYGDPYLYVQNLSLEYNRRIKPSFIVGLGFEVMDDGIDYEFKKYRTRAQVQEQEYLPFAASLSTGPYLNLELLFNRLSFVLQPGYYLTHPHREILKDKGTSTPYRKFIEYTNPHYLFSRVGFRYRFDQHWFINVSAKTQLFKAQFMEFGIGTHL